MEKTFTVCLWKNFGAAIDMFSNAVEMCTDELWEKEKKFFYMSYHTVIFLDYYLSIPARSFKPLLPYALIDPAGLPADAVDDVIPDRFYSREEILNYIAATSAKCKKLILAATSDQLNKRWIEDTEVDIHGLCPPLVVNYSMLEILFYNFRHVQHHVAQLNYILRQKINKAPDWVAEVES
ncbi:MAG: hypothetical protein QM791_06505 [Ferruginibacter sp.]